MLKKLLSSAAGITAALSYIGLVIKYPLRKLGFHKLNARLMELHEAFSGIFFLAASLHGVLQLKGKGKRSLPALLLGALGYVICFVLIAACHMTKDQVKKLRDHRVYSLAGTLAICGHIAAAELSKR